MTDELLDPTIAAINRIRSWVREARVRVAQWDVRPCPDWYEPHEHDRT
jgi:hypothetical protein